MIPKIVSSSHVPERILLYGAGGVGKTRAALSIANRIDGNMWVIDTDYSASYDRMLATEFSHLGNVSANVVGPDDFMGVMDQVRALKGVVGPGDWVVLDSISPTWDAVQSWFVEQVHGQNIEEYFLAVRARRADEGRRARTLGALDGWMDWPVINKVYFRLYAELMGLPANILLTAEQQAISDDDGRDIQSTFSSVGVKPRGQKKLTHVTHTILLMSKSRVGEYSFTTIKDRGRKEVEGQKVNDFALDYLMAIGGWKIGAVEGSSVGGSAVEGSSVEGSAVGGSAVVE